MTNASCYAVALGLAGCLGLMPSRDVCAQEAPPRWWLAGGTELRASTTAPGAGNLVGLVGREWQRPGSRVSSRLDLSYYRRAVERIALWVVRGALP